MTNVGYQMKTIADKIKDSGDRELRKHGVTLPQSGVLMELSERGGSATQKDLEDALQISHATISGLVSRMEKAGFLRCYPDPDDRRNKIVEMTDKARDNVDQMRASIAQNEAMLLEGLSDQEVAELDRMLGVIARNLSKAAGN